MFISRKRSSVLLILILLVSLWIVFQNVSLHKSLFNWTHTRHEAIQLAQINLIPRNPNIKRVSFEFHPPPALQGETQSEGYNVEDMYFRRWQVAHNVDPVRAVREKLDDMRWKGWSGPHHGRGIGNPKAVLADNMYEAMRKRQEDSRFRQAEAMRRKYEDQKPHKQSYEGRPESEVNGNDIVANGVSSPFIIQSTWLKNRLEDYCNEDVHMRGDEGVPTDGYRLRSAYVLARHGDRTPLENGKTGKLAPYRWECNLAEGNKKIGSIHMDKFLRVMQAGLKDINSLDPETKSLLQRIPVGDSDIACYASQLTPRGWVQHMRLGDYLKKRYWIQLQLDSERKATQRISIKSTISPRTQQSAIAFLSGFLPRFSIFDVTKIKISEHPTFCMERNCLCGAVDKLREYVSLQYHRFYKVKNTTSLSNLVSRLMYVEDPLYSVPNPNRLIELLTARACHKSHPPCTENGCVDEDMFERVFKTVDSISAAVRAAGANSSAEMYGRLAMHPLLSMISLTMRYIDKGQSSLPRFYMYMGHDITLTPLLDALGLTYPWPGYASRIVLEHWHHSATDQSSLKFLYNGVDVTHKVSFCRGALNNGGLCPFENFYNFVDIGSLQAFGATTYDAACAWGMGEVSGT